MAPGPFHGSHPLVLQCVGEICRHTMPPPMGGTPQQALQACGDAWVPWVQPADHPAPPRQVFTLLGDCHLDADAHVWVACTPEEFT